MFEDLASKWKRFSARNDPEGPYRAVRETEADTAHRRNLWLAKWNPPHEMYPLNYGAIAMGFACAATSFIIQYRYRRFLNLGMKGYATQTISACFIPSAVALAVQYTFVTQKIMDMTPRSIPCPVCLEMRSIATQLIAGIAYPMVGQTFMSLFLAGQYLTQAIPKPNEPRAMYSFWKTGMNKNMGPILTGMAVFHVVSSVVFVYSSLWSYEKLLAFENRPGGRTEDEEAKARFVEPRPGAQQRVVIRPKEH